MGEGQTSVMLTFTDATEDRGNQYATDLRAALLRIDPTVQVQRQRDRGEAQDFGSTLVLVLGTSAISALAHGIAAWLQRNAGARISVKKADGTLVATGLDSKDVASVVQALSRGIERQ